jgi:hypothetical protein
MSCLKEFLKGLPKFLKQDKETQKNYTDMLQIQDIELLRNLQQLSPFFKTYLNTFEYSYYYSITRPRETIEDFNKRWSSEAYPDLYEARIAYYEELESLEKTWDEWNNSNNKQRLELFEEYVQAKSDLDNKLMAISIGIKAIEHQREFILILQEVYCPERCKDCPHDLYWSAIWEEENTIVLEVIGPGEIGAVAKKAAWLREHPQDT